MSDILSGLIVAIIAVAASFFAGRSVARKNAEMEQQKATQKAKERIDAVSVDGLTDDDVTRRLRDHAKR